MKIFIDGDGCSKIHSTIDIAKKFGIPVELYHDTNSFWDDDYASCHTVDKGKDMVDFAIVNHITKGDIVITNDGGLAGMVLARGGFPMNTRGVYYTERNINSFLNARYLTSSTRRKTGRNKVNRIRHKTGKYDFNKALSNLITIATEKTA